MKSKILIAGVAVAAMTAMAAQAASSRHSGGGSAGAYAEPSQPIAYSNLNTYLKASPKVRRTRDWSGGSAAAATSAGANASATMPNPGGAMPVSPQTQTADPNVADTPPTVAPDVNSAAGQAPLAQTPSNTNAQPPASNQPVTTNTPGSTGTGTTTGQ